MLVAIDSVEVEVVVSSGSSSMIETAEACSGSIA